MQYEYIGPQSITALTDIITQAKARKILLFTGKNSFEQYKDTVLSNIPCEFDTYNDFEVNPKRDQVRNCLQDYAFQQYDMLIAVGGGSVIDFAKLYKYYGVTDAAITTSKDVTSTLPLVAIPTTAGTGSEVTQFAIVYINGEKHTIDAPFIYPEYAIIDSTLLSGSPRYVKACTAMDAYCQAIESYWAVASTTESRDYAQKAIRLAHENIQSFVNSEDSNAAANMALASNLAGKAIQISKTTAAHALCYKLTTGYGIPHGHAVALSMIDLFAANASVDAQTCQDPRGVIYVREIMQDILHMLHTKDFSAYWKALATSLGLEMSFKVLQVQNREEVFATVNEQRLKNNPKNIVQDLNLFWLS